MFKVSINTGGDNYASKVSYKDEVLPVSAAEVKIGLNGSELVLHIPIIKNLVEVVSDPTIPTDIEVIEAKK